MPTKPVPNEFLHVLRTQMIVWWNMPCWPIYVEINGQNSAVMKKRNWRIRQSYWKKTSPRSSFCEYKKALKWPLQVRRSQAIFSWTVWLGCDVGVGGTELICFYLWLKTKAMKWRHVVVSIISRCLPVQKIIWQDFVGGFWRRWSQWGIS